LGQLGYLFIYRGLSDFISYDNGKLKSETHWKDEEKEGLKSFWFESGEKKHGDT
jgi:antitoxin component YwqK of YwqJK toxin-antitoxin module